MQKPSDPSSLRVCFEHKNFLVEIQYGFLFEVQCKEAVCLKTK